MISNRICSYLDELDEELIAKLRDDAEYWQECFSDEVRIGRKERYIAFMFGFCTGLACAVVVAVGMAGL